MINRAGLHSDAENSQSIASGRGFFCSRIAVRPDDRGNSRCSIYADRIARDGLCEFAIDIDDAIGAVGRRGVGCPATAIIWRQRGRRRTIGLTEYDGERSNRCAGNSL